MGRARLGEPAATTLGPLLPWPKVPPLPWHQLDTMPLSLRVPPVSPGRPGPAHRRARNLCCPLLDEFFSSIMRLSYFRITELSSLGSWGLDMEKSVCVRALVQQYERQSPDEQVQVQPSR